MGNSKIWTIISESIYLIISTKGLLFSTIIAPVADDFINISSILITYFS